MDYRPTKKALQSYFVKMTETVTVTQIELNLLSEIQNSRLHTNVD